MIRILHCEWAFSSNSLHYAIELSQLHASLRHNKEQLRCVSSNENIIVTTENSKTQINIIYLCKRIRHQFIL